jgi:hypothetical protein
MTERPDDSTAQHTITVHFVVRGADRAANWYVQALGAEERGRVPVPDGRFMQIELRRSLLAASIARSASTPTTSRRSGSGPRRQAPRSCSRSRTCSGATAMGKSSIPSATSGHSPNTSETFPLRRSEPPRQRCLEVSHLDSAFGATGAEWLPTRRTASRRRTLPPPPGVRPPRAAADGPKLDRPFEPR